MKISVITAVYNSESTIAQCIASVAQQSHSDVEHLIIEGQSQDRSLSIIEQAAHERMYLFSEPDAGIYDALNKGIQRATGDVVGFVHSDDFLANGATLAKIAKAFEDPDVEAVFGDLDYVSNVDVARVIRRWSTGPFDPKKLRHGWMPAHPTLYVRRNVYEKLGLFDQTLKISADYDFVLRYFSQVHSQPVYIPEVLYKMRLGGVSNRSLRNVTTKMLEDYRALRRNNVGGMFTLAAKNLSKIPQFLPQRRLSDK